MPRPPSTSLPTRRHLLDRLSSRMHAIGLALALLTTAAAHAASPSLEQLRSYAYPQGLTASQHQGTVAWSEDRQGRKAIWIAQSPGFLPRQVAAYDKDEGQELTSLSLSDDGRTLVYVRGGEHGGNWDTDLPANPDSAPQARHVQLWSLPVAGGTPCLLGDGDDPAISPDGHQVAFIRAGAAWIVPIDGSQEAKPLFVTHGQVSQLAWSPDGRSVAFVADRGSHSLIGVYQDADTPLQWIAPSPDRDDMPRWSPDGRKLSFVRSAGEGGAPPPRLQLTPKPWAIWEADLASHDAHLRWSSGTQLRDSQPGDGLLEWTAAGGIVFNAYHDGWVHLYLLPAGTGQPRLLTPGQFQVEDVHLSADRSSLVYNANAGSDPDDSERRHLFEVRLDRETTPQALTSGKGSEWAPVPSAGRWLFFSADARRPPQAAMADGKGGIALLAPPPADYPSAALVQPRRVQFQAADGVTAHGQLFEPAGKGPHPAVVYVHGGPQRQMLLGWHYMDYYANDYALNQYLASLGFVVLSVNYRLGPGYGFDYHRPAQAGLRGASEYRDVQAAGHYLQTLGNVDPARIGIYGGSYGGYLTAMALAHDSALFKAGVDIHGVHDWVADEYDGLFTRTRYEVPADAAQAMDVAWRASPVSALDGWTSPVLFIHGDDDRNVKVEQTIDLVQRLRQRGVELQTMILVDETHSIQRYDNALRMDTATAQFLQEKLAAPVPAR